jgi:hypothetical protein
MLKKLIRSHHNFGPAEVYCVEDKDRAFLQGLKTCIREEFAEVSHHAFARAWQELEYRFGISQVTPVAFMQL